LWGILIYYLIDFLIRVIYMVEEMTVVEMNICHIKWGGFAFLGILGVIFGILMLLFPGVTATVVVVLFGVVVLILSLLALIAALLSPAGAPRSGFLLLAAVIGFIFGISSFIVPQVIAVIITEIIAIILFIIGILYLLWAATEKNVPHRWVQVLIGILSFIFAIIFMIYPLLGAIILLGYLVGVYFIIYGILSLVAAYIIHKMQKGCKPAST